MPNMEHDLWPLVTRYFETISHCMVVLTLQCVRVQKYLNPFKAINEIHKGSGRSAPPFKYSVGLET